MQGRRIEAARWVEHYRIRLNRAGLTYRKQTQHNRGKPDMQSTQQKRQQGARAALAQAAGA